MRFFSIAWTKCRRGRR